MKKVFLPITKINMLKENTLQENEQYHPEEMDEYTIGGDGTDALEYKHVVQESLQYDLNQIGSVEPELDFDEDWYQEWLEDNELEDNQETRLEYVKTECEFNLTYYDSETFHIFDYDKMYYDELEDTFGSRMANDMLMSCLDGKSERFETLMYTDDDEVDVNDIHSMEEDAMRKLRHGGYSKGARGFILTNGEMVYTDAEHNMITRVVGIDTKFDAVKKGWIRVLSQAIDVGMKPTMEQKDVLRKVIATYSNEVLYLDLFSNGSESGCQYQNPDWREVLNDIDRFYNEGIKPTGGHGTMYESKNMLQENVTDILYHFTTLHGLIGILVDNAFETRLTRKDMWAFSFTRQRTSKVGYAAINNTASLYQHDMNQCLVRLTIDGRELGYNYKGIPYNHFYNKYDDSSDKSRMTIDHDNNNNRFESEDCVLNYESTIPNALRYIQKIDILFRPNFHDGGRMFEEYYYELQELSELEVYANIYFNEDEFNSLNGKGMSISMAMEEIQEMMYSGEYYDDEDGELYEESIDTNNVFPNSKVRNIDGTLKMMYRGDKNDFNVFDKSQISDHNLYGRGFYFTDSQTHANTYGNVKQYYLNIENPLSTTKSTFSEDMVLKFLVAVDENEDYGLYNYGYGSTPQNVLQKVFDGNRSDFSVIQDINAACIGDMVAATELFNEVNGTTFDGFILDTETVVFDNSQIKRVKDNLKENNEYEVAPSDVDLSSFEVENTLAPRLWNGIELDGRARLKLLDIADEFFETLDIKWVKPKDIILTGSICNFNWSKFSDIDLHIVIDYADVDERLDLVKNYLDGKKNEWNENHSELTIYDFPVELYVQDIREDAVSNGVYSLEKNTWLSEPTKDSFASLDSVSDDIKDIAATLMTYIDDVEEIVNNESDLHHIEEKDEDMEIFSKLVRQMRKFSLDKNGESGVGNVVYKLLRRFGYLDKMWDLKNKIYDRLNSIE